MTTTLEAVWQASSDFIGKVLLQSGLELSPNILINKVKLAQLYASTKNLTPEDTKIVNHPLFERIALKLGRLEDIMTKISVLIYLDPIFDEVNLISIIANYNPITKIYLFGDNLETRNSETLSIETVIPLSKVVLYSEPHYYKGSIYLLAGGSLVSTNPSSDQQPRWNLIKEFPQCDILGMVGNLLYLTTRKGIKSYDMGFGCSE
jgi:hypothetical protein